MSTNIGEAQIEIQIAMERLTQDLNEAMAKVNTAVTSMKKDIVLNVDTNVASKVQNFFNQISQSMTNVQHKTTELGEDFVKSTNVIESTVATMKAGIGDALDDVGRSMSGTGVNVSALGETMLGVFGSGGAVAAVLVVAAELVAALVLIGKFIYDVGEKVAVYIGQNEDLTDAIDKVTGTAKFLWQSLVDLYNEIVDKLAVGIIDFIKGLKETWDEMNKTTGAGDNLLGSLQNLVKTGFESVMRIVNSVIGLFSAFSGANDESKSKVDNLATALNVISGIFNAVAWAVNALSSSFSMMVGWATKVANALEPVRDILSKITNFIAGIPGFVLSSVFGSGGYTPDISGGQYGPEQYVDTGKMKSGESSLNQYGEDGAGPGSQEGKNDRAKYLMNLKSKGGSKGSSREEDPYKAETEELTELLRLQDLHLQDMDAEIIKGTQNLQNRKALIDTYIQELKSIDESLGKTENKNKVEAELSKLKKEQATDSKEMTEAEKSGLAFLSEQTEDAKKRLIENKETQKNAENELQRLKITNEGNIDRLQIFNINDKYNKKKEAINKELIDEKTKIAIIKELETARIKEIRALEEKGNFDMMNIIKSGFGTVTSAIVSQFSNAWTKIFGEANSLFEMLMQSIYQQLIDLAASAIFKTIIKALSGGGGGGFFGFISSLFGEGGYTGDGPTDEPAGVVHRKEFVVNNLGASIPGNRELLEAMNRGEDVASLLGRYESGRVNAEALTRSAISSIGSFDQSGKTININIDGVHVKSNIQKLTGLSENDWSELVDNEMLPQISKGLKRAGKEVLDNSIN